MILCIHEKMYLNSEVDWPWILAKKESMLFNARLFFYSKVEVDWCFVSYLQLSLNFIFLLWYCKLPSVYAFPFEVLLWLRLFDFQILNKVLIQQIRPSFCCCVICIYQSNKIRRITLKWWIHQSNRILYNYDTICSKKQKRKYNTET